ncbi:MAG: nitroreductase family protein [Planctomycetota bacterium]|jgi:nitroreductase/NAD-dependent dihydropyrimidine dehydrogenase PreA subunit|nr:nitroreductase family protein [Planctomycetota bacterium]
MHSDPCRFQVDAAKCDGCGECAADCVAGIIHLRDGLPRIPLEKRGDGIGCQHCLAICPSGAVSVLGLDPAGSISLENADFHPEALDLLVRSRRSIRRFDSKPVPRKLIEELLETTAHAPTGVNHMHRRFTVLATPAAMDRFRAAAMSAVLAAAERGTIPDYWDWLPDSAREWQKGGPDEMFRNAPHLLVLSCHRDSPCPQPDGFIALSHFDLAAQSRGVGTVWGGIPYAVIEHLAPELRRDLDLPEDHLFIYAMMFGFPAARHRRAVQRRPEDVRWLD